MGEELHRREVVAELLRSRPDDLLVIGGLGTACSDLASVGDHPGNFYVRGAMGQAAAIGLGLALAQPQRRVLVLTGDGDMLMGLGTLATVADQQPQNLALVVLDNGSFGETGGQATATRGRTDLAAIARGAGIATTFVARTMEEIASVREAILTVPGPVFAVVKVLMEKVPRVLDTPREGAYLKDRFREHLLGYVQEPV